MYFFLIDQEKWQLREPHLGAVVSEVLVCTVITISLSVVRYKTKQITLINNSKFKNPIKNVNIVIIMVIAIYASLQLVFFHMTRVPLLVFPRFPCGLTMTSILTAFLLNNGDAR